MEILKNKFISLIEDLSAEVAISFKINRQNKSQLCTMAIYATIIENSTACAHLMNRTTFSTLPYLLRANLEALIDLKNSIEGEQYYKRLHATFLNQKKKYLKSKVRRGNEISGPKSDEFKKIEKEYNQIKDDLNNYIKNGFGPLSVIEKFDFCNSLEDYETTYAGFSLETHNDLSVLEKRHIIHDKNDVPNIVIFRERNKLDKEMFLSVSIGVLRLATEQMVEFLKIKDGKEILRILNRFKELEKEIKDFV